MTSAAPHSTRAIRPLRDGAMGNVDLRRHNLALVLKAAHANGPVTRAHVAKVTGLTKTAVTVLVGHLLENGILDEDQAVAGRAGRPSVLLRFAGHRFIGASIEIHASSIETLITDMAGTVLGRHRELIHAAKGQPLIDLVRRQVVSAYNVASRQNGLLLGMAIAVHGVVNPHDGTVLSAPPLGWHDVDLKAALSPDIPAEVPITIDHDANLAAIAEARHSTGSGARNLVSISSDLGIGAGIILHDVVYRGSHGYAAELGHMLLDPGGPVRVCGRRGCWSALIGSDGPGRRRVRHTGAPADPVTVA